MTGQQLAVLRFLDARLRETGVCPAYSEIADAVGVSSKGNVARYVKALEAQGLIRRLPGRVRAIEVIRRPWDKGTGAAEIARLAAENARLREQLAEAQEAIAVLRRGLKAAAA